MSSTTAGEGCNTMSSTTVCGGWWGAAGINAQDDPICLGDNVCGPFFGPLKSAYCRIFCLFYGVN